MLKTVFQRGRSERIGEEVRSALRVGRSPLEWILANGKAPQVIPTSGKLCSVRGASKRRENEAWGEARLGAPGLGG